MDQVTKLTQALVEIPSVTGNEKAVLDFVAVWLREHEFDEVYGEEKFVYGRVNGAGSQPNRRALILCGHIDTVAPGDESAWTYGPWSAHIDSDRLYGLGSGDMKAGVAIQMISALNYQTERRDFDIWVVAVADEEVSGAGSEAFVRHFVDSTSYDEAYCMIAEPTDEATIEIGHRGNRFVKLLFSGEAAHASQETSFGTSAIAPALRFLDSLAQVRDQLHSHYSDEVMGQPSFTPTRVGHGESFSLNKTTDITTVSVDIRTTPALDRDFEAWIVSLAEVYGFSWEYEAGAVPSALCADDALIFQTAKEAMGVETGSISHGATDQAFFQQAGIQTVVFGPGDFPLAHTCNESVSIKRMEEACRLYARIISRM